MITLIQLIRYMIKNLKFTEEQVREHFQKIQRGETNVRKLSKELGLTLSPMSVLIAHEKIDKWPSALNFVQLRHDA